MHNETTTANAQQIITRAYAAFNKRNAAGALALMSAEVSWPKASEGGRVVGKDEISAYWTRQWKEFNPYVEPIEVTRRDDGKFDVRVHQLVKSLNGDVLFDGDVWHVHTIVNGLIERMDLAESEGNPDAAPSAAFAAH